jgi:hypothetical protein
VRKTAGDDEDCEAQKYPVVPQINAPVDEIEKRAGNRKIRQSGESVGDDMEREYVRLPLIAHAVGHESVRGKKASKE